MDLHSNKKIGFKFLMNLNPIFCYSLNLRETQINQSVTVYFGSCYTVCLLVFCNQFQCDLCLLAYAFSVGVFPLP